LEAFPSPTTKLSNHVVTIRNHKADKRLHIVLDFDGLSTLKELDGSSRKRAILHRIRIGNRKRHATRPDDQREKENYARGKDC
jgi:hypothetical protein